MAENHQNNFPSPPPEQPPFSSAGGSNQLFNFDHFINYSSDKQPLLGVDTSVSLQDKDPERNEVDFQTENQHDDLADNEAGDNTDNQSENARYYEEPSEVDALLDSDVPALTVQHAVLKLRAPPIRQNKPAKKKKQENDNTTIITDEGAATAIEATTAVSAPAVSAPAVSIPNDPLIAEMQDLLKEKEEFSLLAKRKIPGATNYERSMRSALLKIDEMNAKYQSFRITTSDSYAVLHARMADMAQQASV